MGSGKIAAGIILSIIGIVLSFFFIFFGIILIVFGIIFIIFNSAEEELEPRKDKAKIKTNKKAI